MNPKKSIIPNRKLVIVLSLFVGFGLIFVLVLFFNPIKPPLPGQIKSQVTSTILVPEGSGYVVDRESVKYAQKDKLLTFKITKNDKTLATITQQPTPDTFVDIPEFSTKFFQQAGEYKTFDTAIGTVHLLRPGNGVADAAAMNTKGTLMFINPVTKLSEADWRKLFQAIVAI